MMNKEKYFLKTREIDIKRMIWCVLKKWLLILVAGIASMVIFGAFQYRKDYKTALLNQQNIILQQAQKEETNEEIIAQLTPQQISGVENAVYFYNTIVEQNEYLSKSVLMNLNLYQEPIVILKYKVVADIRDDFVNFISEPEMSERLKHTLKWETEAHYIGELIRTEVDDNWVTIKVCADTEEKCATLAENLKKELGDYILLQQEKNSGNVIQLESEARAVIVDTEMIDFKNELLKNYYQNTGYHEMYYETLKEKQIVLYERIIQGIDAEEANEDASNYETMDIQVTLSKKAMGIGLIAGILLAIVFFCIRYTFSNRIHGEEELQYLFATTNLGTIDTLGLKKKSLFVGIAMCFNRLITKRKKEVNYEQEIEMVSSRLILICERNQTNQVYLSGSEMKQIPGQVIETIKEKLSLQGIQLVQGESIAWSGDALLNAAKYGSVAFIEIDEISKCEEIVRELNICIDNEITNCGIILLQR